MAQSKPMWSQTYWTELCVTAIANSYDMCSAMSVSDLFRVSCLCPDQNCSRAWTHALVASKESWKVFGYSCRHLPPGELVGGLLDGWVRCELMDWFQILHSSPPVIKMWLFQSALLANLYHGQFQLPTFNKVKVKYNILRHPDRDSKTTFT